MIGRKAIGMAASVIVAGAMVLAAPLASANTGAPGTPSTDVPGASSTDAPGASFADDPGTASTERAGNAVDPCALPKAQRKGGWLCIDREESEKEMRAQIAREKLRAATLGRTSGFAVTGDGVAGKCMISGCWYIQSGYASASFSGKGYYGVNSTQLGSVTFNIKDNMKGNQTETSVQSAKFNTRSSWENHWQTERYYVSGSCTGGCPMSPRSVEWQNDVSTCAGCTNSWAPIYTVGKTAYATTLHRLVWRVYNYTGYWWANIKSVKAWRNSAGTQYWYSGTYDDPALVSTPYAGGYSQFG